jgi:peptide/nickel transport system permease protein
MVTRLGRYAITRILFGIPVLFLILVLFFYVTHVLPGDPAVWLAGDRGTPADIEEIRHKMGFDRPIHIQFVEYFSSLLLLDLGKSFTSARPVTDELAQAYPVTLELAISATILGILIGIPTGVLAALKKDTIIDQFLRIFSVSFISLPVFWLGMLLQMSLSVGLGFFPVAGRLDVDVSVQRITGMLIVDSLLTLNFKGLASSLRYIFLPSLTLALYMFPGISRIARASMITELSEEYVTTAKAKGCSRSSIVYKHVLRNAMIPTVTMIGMSFVGLIGGVVLTETVFSLPGIGRLLVTAAYGRDYPLLQGCVLAIALVILAVTTILDTICAKLDPRLTME